MKGLRCLPKLRALHVAVAGGADRGFAAPVRRVAAVVIDVDARNVSGCCLRLRHVLGERTLQNTVEVIFNARRRPYEAVVVEARRESRYDQVAVVARALRDEVPARRLRISA